jgi:ABC-2 type transport system ATP-binding protein
VTVFGEEVDEASVGIRARIGYVPEGSELPFPGITAARMLRHHAAYFPDWDPAYAATLVKRLGVPAEARCGRLSKGEARRLTLVMALAHRPPLLLFDEPTDGFDPLARQELHGLLVEHMTDTPTTILWSTHHVAEAEGLADHVGVLHRGRMLVQAPRDTLERQVRRYRLHLPPRWIGIPPAGLLRREGTGGDQVWTVWGDEVETAAALSADGAVVRDVSPLTLEELAFAFLAAGGQS